jgi:hypothetical protein
MNFFMILILYGINQVALSQSYSLKNLAGSYRYENSHGSLSGHSIGSSARHVSTKYHGSASYSSSNKYSGSPSYSSSNKYHGSASYSSSNKYSGSIVHSSINYGVFMPTYHPTESALPIIYPPNPTHRPTRTMNIVGPSKNYVPETRLTFQIKQGTTDWATYTDEPVDAGLLRKAVSKITNLADVEISKFQVLSNSITKTILYSLVNSNDIVKDARTLKYNITTHSTTTPKLTYQMASTRLIESTKNNNFTRTLRELGLLLNVTSIEVSPYFIIYGPNSPLESNGASTMDINKVYISVAAFIAIFGVLMTVTYFICKRRRLKIQSDKISLERKRDIDVIPNPLQQRRIELN